MNRIANKFCVFYFGLQPPKLIIFTILKFKKTHYGKGIFVHEFRTLRGQKLQLTPNFTPRDVWIATPPSIKIMFAPSPLIPRPGLLYTTFCWAPCKPNPSRNLAILTPPPEEKFSSS